MPGRGYVKLHREAIEHPVFQDDFIWKLFCWCLVSANYRDVNTLDGVVPRGSFTTGRLEAADFLGCTGSKWYRGILKLKDAGSITVKSNNKFTTISICNYSTYQDWDGDDRTTNEQRMNNGRTTDEQPANTILRNSIKEECKEGKEGARILPADPMIFDMAWKSWPVARRINPIEAKDKWAEAVALIAGRNGGNLWKAGDWLLKRIESYCKSPAGKSQFVFGLARWLEKGKYDEDDETWQRGGDDDDLREVSQYPQAQPIPKE